ncbi:helix-hairpin-helix domain-containing protein [Schinkia sp. CFF1]
MNKVFSNKKVLIIIACLMLVTIAFLFIKDESHPSNDEDFSAVKAENKETFLPEELMNEDQTITKVEPAIIYIDIKGAVVKPGVYQLEENSRVQDAIKLAGGFLEKADQTKINLAARVLDEMVLYIPEVGELSADGMEPPLATQVDDKKININTATSEELQSLPGIGASKAAGIITYREENGPFKKIEDLMNVSGIGEKSFEHLKDQIKLH